MRINSIKQDENKIHLSITFYNESEERAFLQKLESKFGSVLPIHCMITDLDTICPMYEEYFPRGNYYVIDHITTLSIFAFQLNHTEVCDVISNWGYYTLDAILALGNLNSDRVNELKSLPIVVSQVLDYSLSIEIERCFYQKFSKLIEAD